MASFKYAFSLSKQELAEATPPGTSRLIAQRFDDEPGHIHHLRLVPQPSSDAADPLNWPMWRKIAILLCMSIDAFIGNFASSSIASALPLLATPLAFNPPVAFSRLSQLIAVNVLMQGVANIWWVPLANTFGRRPVILISLVLLVFSSMWAGLATSFSSLLAARVFMGIGQAPSEAVSPDVVGEIFFTHQTGRAMGVYTIFLLTGSLVGGISGGYIAGNMGIPWIHWINVILAAITLVLCFFLAPETMFDRQKVLGLNSRQEPSLDTHEKVPDIRLEQTTTHHNEITGSYSFLRSLKIGTYRPGLLRRFFAPYKTLRLPGVWLVMFWYAGLVGGIVAISTVGPTIVASPPYLWGANAGLINVGGLVGSVLGAAATYLSVDHALTSKAKHGSHGLSEAEDRLPVTLPGLFLATCGLWTFGFSAWSSLPKAWVGMEVGLGMLAFGLMQAPSVGFNYLIESYNAVSGDCFVAVTTMRAIVAFSWTFFVGEWVTSAGPAVPFGVFGGLMGLFSLMVIPIWVWGKRLRIVTEKWLPREVEH
ncbi:MFS general substrate transporter [Pseudovirgaria hyperparasitica]|uniref:MFS general substrate transporter n=1 Tax=Pseudovirgaria hyperparasitica TaxID=470096 RepID=A0A6A6WJ26_9PEZI|nr:MFS general substrate transporter [Pseudovirgaria hyperparasitica]KAF2762120.1 MFS general substrate transporter [Pseudovirgaria hyperparasitica]